MAKNRYDPKSIDELMGKWSNKITQFGAKTDSLQVLQAELDKALGPILSKKVPRGKLPRWHFSD
ncbi:hypothetical protein [Pseudoalteromonas phenolica]|uniref:hypothetical protein n=1 Tax=Pseudoalteromonas phenolica TaxID=161398 RepID=UPI0030C8ACC0